MDSGIELGIFFDDSQLRSMTSSRSTSMTASRDHEAVPPVRRKTGLDKLLEDFGIRPVPEDTAEEDAQRERARAQTAEEDAQRERARAQTAEDDAQRERVRAQTAEEDAQRERARAQAAEEEARKEKERADAADIEVQRLRAELYVALRSNPRPALRAEVAADVAEMARTGLIAQYRLGGDLSLERFNIGRRLGARTNPTVLQLFYGVNSAVFVADDKSRPDAPPLAFKVIYNVHGHRDLSKTFKSDFEFIECVPNNHPNIVTGFGHFQGLANAETMGPDWDADPNFVRPDCKSLFVVMERIGTTLKSLISSRVAAPRPRWPPVLSVDEFLVIHQRVLRGVDHLQRNGIVHRDIKADNILVDIRPADDASPFEILIKVADFGCALKPRYDNLRELYVNEDLPKGGAAAFLAPEVTSATPGTLDDPKYIDYSKNDIFAVGMMAHSVLTNGVGEVFSDDGLYSDRTYTSLPDGCPEAIADLVWAMVNPSYEHRITAGEALARVDELIEGPELQWG